MFRRNQNALTALFSRLSGSASGSYSPLGISKPTRRRAERRGGAVCSEQLESRQLLTGLTFDSVVLAESDLGAVYSQTAAVDGHGNTYMGGQFSGEVDFDRNAVHLDNADVISARGRGDAFIAKYGTTGQLLWVRRIGGDSPEMITDDAIANIEVGAAGDVYIAGRFSQTADFGTLNRTSSGLTDAYVAKLDMNGSLQWVNTWGTTNDDAAENIAVDSAGRVTVAGQSSGISPTQLYLRQYDSSGNLNWAQEQFSTSNSVEFSDLQTAPDGSIYALGAFNGSVDLDPTAGEQLTSGAVSGNTLFYNAFLTKLTPTGQFEWSTNYAAASGSSATVHAIAVAPDGSVFTTGRYQGNVTIATSDVNDSGLPESTSSRMFFSKISVAGELLQLQSAAWITQSATRIAATNDGVLVMMNFVNALNLAPGLTLQSPTGKASTAFVQFSNELEVVTGFSNVIQYSYNDLTTDAQGNVYIPGWTSNSPTDYDPNPNTTHVVVTSTGTANGSVVKLKPTPATKFYVVDDASNNRTFEYGADGSAVENYSINSGNSAPRGAASTVAGDKVWVVDANKKVYVYSDAGSLLGSWTAGSVASNATIEGITTNGTDVWLVDARQDRVFRYANAAGRLSGSQNATSNFSLNSGNTSPKDIVTDGVSVWVANDSTTDKVFKYTVAGNLSGSWTIDSANQAPTGLTIDPSGASQSIWIVDNGTDRVYEYTNGRSRSLGSQTASVTFALTAGNTNPQGIADPPAPTTSVLKTTHRTAGSHAATAIPIVNCVSAAVAGGRLEFREGSSLQHITGTSIENAASVEVETLISTEVIGNGLMSTLSLAETQTSDLSSLDSLFGDFNRGLEEGLSSTLQSPLTGALKKRMLR